MRNWHEQKKVKVPRRGLQFSKVSFQQFGLNFFQNTLERGKRQIRILTETQGGAGNDNIITKCHNIMIEIKKFV